MIAVPYCLLLLFLLAMLIDTRKAILVAVMIRPITDCFYEAKYAFGGLKPTEFLGILLPTFIFFKIISSSEQSFTRAPLSALWIVYIFFQLFGTVLILTVGDDAMMAADYFFRAFNGFIGFFIFQEYFRTKEEFRVLLIVHILAGIFPMGMSFYQNILGGAIRSETTIGGLVRNIGFYHDAYTLRLYSFQTLTAMLLYWCYFLSGVKFISRGFMFLMTAIATVTVYKIYSKAGYLILADWLLVWNIAQKKFIRLGVIMVFLTAAFVLTKGKMTETLDSVYSKEVGAIQGKEKSDRLFQGRVGVWKSAFNDYFKSPIFLQMVGDGSSHTGAHNDFVRALLGTGFIGLLLYLYLLGSIGLRALKNCLRRQTPLNITAVMLICMWAIDAMGLVPGAYPGYQILVWGFIGLALRGAINQDFDTSSPSEVPA
jgi:hypothetical protein